MTSDPLSWLRWIDVILVVAATPFVLLMGAPALGFLAGAVAWILTRIAGDALERRATESDDPRKAAGLIIGTGLGRAWALGLTILAVGLAGEREDGLTAAITVFVAFSVYLAARIVNRPQRGKPVSS